MTNYVPCVLKKCLCVSVCYSVTQRLQSSRLGGNFFTLTNVSRCMSIYMKEKKKLITELTPPSRSKDRLFHRHLCLKFHFCLMKCNPPPPLSLTHTYTDSLFLGTLVSLARSLSPPQRRAADAELNVPSGENKELKRSPFKAWSRSVCSHTCYVYCQEFLPCLFLPFQSILLYFFPKPLPILSCVGCG